MSNPNPFQAEPFSDNSEDGPKKIVAKDGHTYHKSATANASTAPTNEHTVQNATQPKTEGVHLTPDELDFITVVCYHYGLTGFPSKEFLHENYYYPLEETEARFKSKHIRAALMERGVEFDSAHLYDVVNETPVEAEDAPSPFPKKAPPPLTPLQLIVANKLLDLSDQKSESKKLRDCGVTTHRFQTWLRDPNFAGYLRDRTENMLGEYQHEAMLSLIDQVRSGNMKAIQYYHEMTGRYITQTAKNAGTTGAFDVKILLIRLIEILEDEIDDNALAARIGERIRGLVSANQTANALMELPTHEVVVPEVATPREITPEIQDMMNKGLGYQT